MNKFCYSFLVFAEFKNFKTYDLLIDITVHQKLRFRLFLRNLRYQIEFSMKSVQKKKKNQLVFSSFMRTVNKFQSLFMILIKC